MTQTPTQAEPGAMPEAMRAAADAARHSYGRLLAWLSWRWRDLAAAEDALADALVAALETWPASGVPASPDSWLLTVAKRRLLERSRHDRVVADPRFSILFETTVSGEPPVAVPDARLRLLFVCAHPAIDERARTPLMLQSVLGLDATRIAAAFLTSPAAMAQRLVRAKARIRESGLGFEEPEATELPGRVRFVLEAAYAAYGTGWDDPALDESRRTDLAEEALFLARLVVSLLPEEPEAEGLLALMQYCESRRAARLDAEGRFVPLSDQDPALWDRALHDEAEAHLQSASTRKRPGPFQIEAAIQSAHMQRLRGGSTPWKAIASLYDVLASTGALGVMVGRAMAHAEAFEVGAGVAALAQLTATSVRNYQPYWVAAATLHAGAGDTAAARKAFERALGLTESALIRAHLERLIARLR